MCVCIILLEKINMGKKIISFDKYAISKQLNSTITSTCKDYLGKMKSGAIECTHDFYLKMYHIMLANGKMNYNTFDVVMVDEAQDLFPASLEIFKLIPAKLKVLVGDPSQSIFSFNKTINSFVEMADEGTMLSMSESFRVSDTIAPSIQWFCNRYFDPNMEFTGRHYSESEMSHIVTSAFISRTNATLISSLSDT